MGKRIDRTGEERINKQGLKMIIINYRNNQDLDVKFEDGYVTKSDYRNFNNGYVKNPNFDYCKKKNRIGEIFITNIGATVKIIEYKDANNVKVKCLETEEIIKTSYRNLQKGNIKPKYYPSVYGVGFIGDTVTIDENKKQLESYKCWHRMLERCYSEEYQLKEPSYIGVTVCAEWKCYSNFKVWYDDNYYKIKDVRMELDKDILVKGNKIYSPETCIFVPQKINSLFVKNDINRGVLPIGVNYQNGYKAKLGDKHLGYFDTPEEAFNSYKEFKENYIKEVAEDYKPYIPNKLYNALINYKVEITD